MKLDSKVNNQPEAAAFGLCDDCIGWCSSCMTNCGGCSGCSGTCFGGCTGCMGTSQSRF